MPQAHAVLIAVPVVDSQADTYRGTALAKLCGSANDVQAMRDLLNNAGFTAVLKQFGTHGAGPAIKSRILSGVEDAVRASQPDDLVIIYFTGHGTRVHVQVGNGPPSQSPEPAWCLHDTVLAWQELLGAILTPAGPARVLVVADCCHAAPRLDLRWLWQPWAKIVVKSAKVSDEQTIRRNVGVIRIGSVPSNGTTSVVYFAACRADQTTLEVNCVSTFTSLLSQAYDRGPCGLTYDQLCGSLAGTLNTSKQHPQVTQLHVGNGALKVQSIAFQ